MDKSIDNIKKTQRDLQGIVLNAVILSVGVNLLISGIGKIMNDVSDVLYILAGVLLTLCPLVIIFLNNFKKSNRNYLISAVVTYDRNTKELIKIRDYNFMEDLCRYMNAATQEDENIKAMWKKDVLGIRRILEHPKSKEECVEVSRSAAALNQLIEYLILKKLGLMTSAYFNKPEFNKRKIIQVERSDINEFVANNVFINLFGKPTYERVAFDNEVKEENVVYCYGKNNAIYDKFELFLPQKCKLSRDNNTIIIKHPYFIFQITPTFTGFGEVLPSGFKARYLKCPLGITSYKVWIGIKLKFTWRAIFMNKERYYEWIDEYIEVLNKYASFEHFKQLIQWDMTNAILGCIDSAE